MSEEAIRRDEERASGRADVTKLPRIVAGVVVVAIIAASVWVLSGARLPFQSAPPPPVPAKIAVITGAVADEAGKPSAPRLGMPAPNFAWLSPDGGTHRLSDFRGRVVVLNWWATWCPPCRAEMPALQRVASREKDVVFLEVDLQEDQQQVADFMERLELRDLVAVIDTDGETAKRYAISAGIPQTFFIGADGRVLHIEPGGPMDEDTIIKGIAKAR